jgi:hypothetical protein
LYRDNNELNEGYQPWTNLVKDQKNNLHERLYSVVNRWKNYFFKLLNVFWVNDISQTEIHRVEPLVCWIWSSYCKAAKI